jgi:hypothetical protein
MFILKKNGNLFNKIFLYIFYIRRKPEKQGISYTVRSRQSVIPAGGGDLYGSRAGRGRFACRSLNLWLVSLSNHRSDQLCAGCPFDKLRNRVSTSAAVKPSVRPPDHSPSFRACFVL